MPSPCVLAISRNVGPAAARLAVDDVVPPLSTQEPGQPRKAEQADPAVVGALVVSFRRRGVLRH